MDSGVEIALIVAGASLAGGTGSFLSGMITARMSRSERREQRQQDWDRQDEVARRVTEAAEQATESTRLQRITVKQAADAADLLKINQEHVAQISEETLGTIRVVHTLVNSKLTGVTQRLLESLMDQEKLMGSRDPSDYEKKQVQAEIVAVRAELDERAAAAQGIEHTNAHHAAEQQEAELDARRRGEDLGR